jgi:hypothetical protein
MSGELSQIFIQSLSEVKFLWRFFNHFIKLGGEGRKDVRREIDRERERELSSFYG